MSVLITLTDKWKYYITCVITMYIHEKKKKVLTAKILPNNFFGARIA